jgi:flagellar hook-length control protein FliK
MLAPLSAALARPPAADAPVDAPAIASSGRGPIGSTIDAGGAPLTGRPLAGGEAVSASPAPLQAAIDLPSTRAGTRDADLPAADKDSHADPAPATAMPPAFPQREAATDASLRVSSRPDPVERPLPQQGVSLQPAAVLEKRNPERPITIEPAASTTVAQATAWSAETLSAATRFELVAPATPAAAAPATELVAPRVGAAAWSEAMGQKIVMMASERIQQAELRLNPEGLGPLQVVLSIDQGAADVQFLAHDPQVREALQSALPRLQEMLTSAGFSLDRVSIDAGTARDQGNRQGEEAFRHAQGRTGDRAETETAPLPLARVIAPARPGRIDTFA